MGFFVGGDVWGLGCVWESFVLVYVCVQESFCPAVNFGPGGGGGAAANEPEEAETQRPRACCADSAPGP